MSAAGDSFESRRKSCAEAMLRHRKLRGSWITNTIFGEFAWDMLLSLYVNMNSDSPLTCKSLIEAIDAPSTTLLRWLEVLVQEGLVTLDVGSHYPRLSTVALSPKGRHQLDGYFTSIIDEQLMQWK